MVHKIYFIFVAWFLSQIAFSVPSATCQKLGREFLETQVDLKLLDAIKNEGVFKLASEERLRQIQNIYLEHKASKDSLLDQVGGRVERVTSADIAIDFNRLPPNEVARLAETGKTALRSEMIFAQNEAQDIVKYGFGGFSKLYYFTSGAGLWSRGGGQIKALIPVNLRNCLSPESFADLTRAGNIATAKDAGKALEAAGRGLGPAESLDEVAKNLITDAQGTIDRLIKEARGQSESLNILDLKFANIALLSRESRSYIHFDVWTSEQTHSAIRDYIMLFKANYRQKTFSPDPAMDMSIKDAIGSYLLASDALGETHLFGYQEGVFALHPDSGEPLRHDSVPIGEGAGMAKKYLDTTGRTFILNNRGTVDWVFQNIEVISPVGLEYAAHVRSGQQVSVVVVPTLEGYAGGSPYRVVTPDNQALYKLLEGTAVPENLANNNDYFNSNTIYQSLDFSPLSNLGFESKIQKNGVMGVRVKMNAGDVTLEHPAALVGGRIGYEYENFKNYGEYGLNGDKLIKNMQDSWSIK